MKHELGEKREPQTEPGGKEPIRERQPSPGCSRDLQSWESRKQAARLCSKACNWRGNWAAFCNRSTEALLPAGRLISFLFSSLHPIQPPSPSEWKASNAAKLRGAQPLADCAGAGWVSAGL